MSTQDNNRLLMEIEKTIREINRQTLHAVFPELKLSDLRPVIELASKIRGRYLQATLDLAKTNGQGELSFDKIVALRQLRETYEELVKGADAVETAIKRDYLDAKR